MNGLTERLAGFSARRPWLMVALWAVIIVAGAASASRIGDVLSSEFKLLNNPESDQAAHLIEDRLRGPEQAGELVIVRSETDGVTVDDTIFEGFVTDIVEDVRALPDVVAAVSFYETDAAELVSKDRRTLVIPLTLDANDNKAVDKIDGVLKVVEERDESADFQVLSAGRGSIDKTFNDLSEKQAQQGESIGAPVALLILIVVFGAIVAAGIPVVLGIVSIVVAVGISALIGQVWELNFLVLNVITMIGLAVGIDYSLFIVQRFREERRHGVDKVAAIERAGATSGRAVLFSGTTVVVALLGMLIVPSNVYRSLAVGASVVAIVAVVAALTLLPAVLSLLGDSLNRLRIPGLGKPQDEHSHGFWDRIASGVMAHPVISIVISVGLLLAAAVPYLDINLGTQGVSSLPAGERSREAFELLASEFEGGRIEPVDIVITAEDVTSDAIQDGADDLVARLGDDGAFGPATIEENADTGIILISTPLLLDPQSDAAHNAVRRLRDEHVPAALGNVRADVAVGGGTAETVDMVETIEQYTPIVLSFVLALSFIVLLVVFRSIVVPIKALVMNLLSVGAAYGLIVLVFQKGVGNELFGFQEADAIEAWLPLFLFSIVFGLSMDYHVFLLSRIRERYLDTRDNAGSVAFGLRSTASLITGAALIMVAVFAGFTIGDLGPLQQMGFGLAVAVILDATLVRCVLVPASMELLGHWNWYLPRWLEWLPDVGVEAPARPRTGTPAVAAGAD